VSRAIKRIAIVGAGMGGLAAAIALHRKGFEVKVYEQSPDLGAFGAGLGVTPNAVKVFAALGLREQLQAVSVEPGGLIWRDSNDGAVTKFVSLERAVERFGAQYYNSWRGDVHNLLSSAVPAP
jgi:salicylate hydroxylase